MGYRSDVGLCLTRNGLSKLIAELENTSDEIRESVKELLDYPKNHFTDSDTGSEIWYWEYVKWYQDDPDVAFMEDVLSMLDYNDYLLIRIGEDSDDNEIQGNYWDNPFGMYLSRTINFDPTGA